MFGVQPLENDICMPQTFTDPTDEICSRDIQETTGSYQCLKRMRENVNGLEIT